MTFDPKNIIKGAFDKNACAALKWTPCKDAPIHLRLFAREHQKRNDFVLVLFDGDYTDATDFRVIADHALSYNKLPMWRQGMGIYAEPVEAKLNRRAGIITAAIIHEPTITPFLLATMFVSEDLWQYWKTKGIFFEMSCDGKPFFELIKKPAITVKVDSSAETFRKEHMQQPIVDKDSTK